MKKVYQYSVQYSVGSAILTEVFSMQQHVTEEGPRDNSHT